MIWKRLLVNNMEKKRVKKNTISTNKKELTKLWDRREDAKKNNGLLVLAPSSSPKKKKLITSTLSSKSDGAVSDFIDNAKKENLSLIPFLVAVFTFLAGTAISLIWVFAENFVLFILGITIALAGLGTSIYAFSRLRDKKPFLRKSQMNGKNTWKIIYVIVSVIVILGLYIYKMVGAPNTPWRLGYSVLDYVLLWTAIAIGWVACLTIVIEKYIETKNMTYKSEADKIKRKRGFRLYLIHTIIAMLVIFFAVPLIFGMTLFGIIEDGTRAFSINFSCVMSLIIISPIIDSALENSPNPITLEDNRNAIQLFLLILIPLISMLIVLPRLDSAMLMASVGTGIETNIPSGAMYGQSFMDIFWTTLVYSREAQVSGVIALVGSLVILIGKSRGQQGTGLMSIGALATAGVPTIVGALIFFGTIEAPTEISDTFAGFSNLIYAIAYLAIMGLYLSILSFGYALIPAESGYGDD